MPIYEYRCEDCDREFEVLVFGSDETPACPCCHQKNVTRILSCTGYVGGSGPGGCMPKTPGGFS